MIPPTSHARIVRRCTAAEDGVPPGAGTVLHEMILKLGIKPTGECKCEAMRRSMDTWHSLGTLDEHRNEILGHLKKAYDQASLLTKMKAAKNAVVQGFPFTLEGLLDTAIVRSNAMRIKP
jgi:hypothetical protein